MRLTLPIKAIIFKHLQLNYLDHILVKKINKKKRFWKDKKWYLLLFHKNLR